MNETAQAMTSLSAASAAALLDLGPGVPKLDSTIPHWLVCFAVDVIDAKIPQTFELVALTGFGVGECRL